jgi:hypothetical protein
MGRFQLLHVEDADAGISGDGAFTPEWDGAVDLRGEERRGEERRGKRQNGRTPKSNPHVPP